MTANERTKHATDEGVYALLDESEQDARISDKNSKSDVVSTLKNSSPYADRSAHARRDSNDSSRYSSHHSRAVTNGGRTRNGDGQRNRYSEEREENDERRSQRSRDLAEDDEMKYGSGHDSTNVVSRAGHRHGHHQRRSRDDQRSPLRDHSYRSGLDSYVPSRHSNDDHGRRSDRHVTDRDRDGRDHADVHEDRESRRERSHRDQREDRNGRERHADDRDAARLRSRSRSPRRDAHRQERDHRQRETKARTPPPAPSSDERDRKTVFVSQLSVRTRSKELKEFFDKNGCPVFETQIVKDRVSGRSKGLGYVEFRTEDSVEKALKLTGHKLNGVPMIVQLTEAEKNRQKRKTEGGVSSGAHPPRLYVGNINFEVTEEDLRKVFEPFGSLDFAKLARDEDGRSKGFGFVQFHDSNFAKQALEAMNGFELGGRALRVGLGSDKMPIDTPNPQQPPPGQGSSFSGSGGRGSHAGGTTNFDRASARNTVKSGGASALDDNDMQGMNYDRTDLMRKLARVDDPQAKQQTKSQEQTIVQNAPQPTRCVVIKNMYDQNDASLASGWQQELTVDVRSECENRYGVVKHISLRLDNDEGEVYIKFDRTEGGQNAVRGLNGRWFGGRSLTASYVVEPIYNTMFPDAASS